MPRPGWRAGFVALALIVLLALPFVVLLIGAGRKAPAVAVDTGPAAPVGNAFASRAFWILIVAFVLIPLAVAGINSLGAEPDLIGYMTIRYFGLARFGRIYGMMYGAVLVGGASSPIAYGRIADITSSYQIGFYAAAAVLAASALLFLALPRFSDASDH